MSLSSPDRDKIHPGTLKPATQSMMTGTPCYIHQTWKNNSSLRINPSTKALLLTGHHFPFTVTPFAANQPSPISLKPRSIDINSKYAHPKDSSPSEAPRNLWFSSDHVQQRPLSTHGCFSLKNGFSWQKSQKSTTKITFRVEILMFGLLEYCPWHCIFSI